jgi:hypothetical protein
MEEKQMTQRILDEPAIANERSFFVIARNMMPPRDPDEDDEDEDEPEDDDDGVEEPAVVREPDEE